VGGRPRGLEAAALVDRDVDEHGVLLHQPELAARDDAGSLGAVDQHRSDHEVDVRQSLLDRQRRGEARVGPAAERDVEVAQAVDRAVVDVDGRLHPDGDERRVHPDDAAADDHHLGAGDARHAAEQDPPAAERLLEHEGAGLGGDLARHLAHRRQQGQAPARVLDRLIRDARRAARHQPARQLRGRSEVQVGEEDVPGLEPRHLLGLGLLDLDDHVGRGEHRVGVREDLRALGPVVRVLDRRAKPGARLHDHLVAGVDKLSHAGRRQRHPVLVRLDLRRDADLHFA
jgi:hypothetical protein